MRPLAALAACLPLALAGAGCGGGGGTPYVEPREPRVDCPPPTVVYGGVNPAADPGQVCLGPPQPSALPLASPAAAVHGWQDLGPHQVGTLVEFQVPPGTASVLLVEQVVGDGPAETLVRAADGTYFPQPNLAVIGELWNPSGQLVYTDLELIDGRELSRAALTVAGAGPLVGSVAYPSTSAGLELTFAGGVAAGAWRAMVNDYAHECYLASLPRPPPGLAGFTCHPDSRVAGTVYRLYALTTPAAPTGPAIPARGTIDVAFHVVDAPSPNPLIGVTAAEAPSHPRTQRMLESFGWLLAGAGVCLGTVTWYEAPDWARARFALDTSAGDAVPCGNLSQLLATSTPGQPRLELFLLPYLRNDPADPNRVIGVDGTIPGPATINGTIAGGAAVSAEDLTAGTCAPPGGAPAAPQPYTCGADKVSMVAAHESGHYLGLYHPSESDGATFDPLGDTPHCECSPACGLTSSSQCVGATAGGLPPDRCVRASARCGGGRNLMFWALSSFMTGYLSPEQARIVRSSPVVRSP